MEKAVSTSDGVAWTVRRQAPRWRRRTVADEVEVGHDDHIGFEALTMLTVAAVLVFAIPLSIQAGHWWVAPVAVLWSGYTWFLHLARWRILLAREGEVQQRFTVRGKSRAARMVAEFAKEIARTPDAQLRV